MSYAVYKFRRIIVALDGVGAISIEVNLRDAESESVRAGADPVQILVTEHAPGTLHMSDLTSAAESCDVLAVIATDQQQFQPTLGLVASAIGSSLGLNLPAHLQLGDLQVGGLQRMPPGAEPEPVPGPLALEREMSSSSSTATTTMDEPQNTFIIPSNGETQLEPAEQEQVAPHEQEVPAPRVAPKSPRMRPRRPKPTRKNSHEGARPSTEKLSESSPTIESGFSLSLSNPSSQEFEQSAGSQASVVPDSGDMEWESDTVKRKRVRSSASVQASNSPVSISSQDMNSIVASDEAGRSPQPIPPAAAIAEFPITSAFTEQAAPNRKPEPEAPAVHLQPTPSAQNNHSSPAAATTAAQQTSQQVLLPLTPRTIQQRSQSSLGLISAATRESLNATAALLQQRAQTPSLYPLSWPIHPFSPSATTTANTNSTAGASAGATASSAPGDLDNLAAFTQHLRNTDLFTQLCEKLDGDFSVSAAYNGWQQKDSFLQQLGMR